ncbi:MAG: tetratricopeptide repeat protein [Thermoanaerobaculia bacterium]
MVSICLLLWQVPAHSTFASPQESAVPSDRAIEVLAEGDSVSAEKEFRRRLVDNPHDFEALVGWAGALAAQGRGAEVLPALNQGAERRLATGAYGEAVELLELAAALDPRSPAAKARLGRALILDRRYLAAEAPLRQALEQGGPQLAWLLQLGSVLWETGELGEAEELLKEAAKRARASAVPWHQLGRFLLWQGRYEESVEALQQAKLLGAGGFDLELDRARALEGWARRIGSREQDAARRKEVLEEALRAFQLAVVLAPEHSEIHYGLARVLAALGRGEEAATEREIYQRLYREDQDRVRQQGLAQARLDHAYDLLRHDRAGEAVAVLTTLPETVEVLQALALAQRENGDLEAARRFLERAVAQAPERRDLRALLTEIVLALE